MNRFLLTGLSLLTLVVGCATPDEASSSATSDLDEAPARITAEALEAKAEAHFDEVEASDPNVPNANTTLLFAVDDDAPVQAEGADQLEDVVMATIFEHSFMLTAKTSPIFRVQSKGAHEPGTHDCKDIQGGVAVKTSDALFRSSVTLPCSITITKSYKETLTPAATLVGMRPRLIVVGHVSATVANEAGATKDVRAGFVYTTN